MYGAKIEVELGGFSAVIREEALVRQVEQMQWLGAKWAKGDDAAAGTRKGCTAPIICVVGWLWPDGTPEGFSWPDLPRDLSPGDAGIQTRLESLRDFIGIKALTKLNEAIAGTIELTPAVEGNSDA